MPGTRNSGVLALGGIALAALLTVIGHVGVDDLDPVTLTVSDYAVSDSGGIIHLAMLTLAVASAAIIPTLRRLAPPDTAEHPGPNRAETERVGVDRVGVAQLLLAVWAGGLLVSGLVPTNPPGTEMDTAAYVHRYASVVAFLALPAAGWLLAARLPAEAHTTARWLRALALTSLLLATAMAWSAYPGDRALYGLLERALILTEVTLLALLTLPTPAPRPSASPSPAIMQSWRPAKGTKRHQSTTTTP
ncbi:DUF998 domain-containing protein [Micromonospora sp. CA-263727]|uniref:DUF998 domain-containing protein n=1 Tax=Micromonospora sp. CA-263727 TaxID=3239967 RepID=UPI003D8E26F2